MDTLIQEKVSQKANELTATYDEKLRNYEDREQDLQRQLSLTKDQLRDLRTSNDSNQAKLFDHSQKQGTYTLLISQHYAHFFITKTRKLWRSSLRLT